MSLTKDELDEMLAQAAAKAVAKMPVPAPVTHRMPSWLGPSFLLTVLITLFSAFYNTGRLSERIDQLKASVDANQKDAQPVGSANLQYEQIRQDIQQLRQDEVELRHEIQQIQVTHGR